MTHGICELLWLRMLVSEHSLHVLEPMSLYCNNNTVIRIAHDPVQHDKTKHVIVDRHFIKDHLKVGRICMPFVQTKDQLVELFTKELIGAWFSMLVDKLGMLNVFSSLRESITVLVY